MPGAGFLYNSVPLIPLGRKTIPRQRLGSRRADAHLDSVGWNGDSPPEAGFPRPFPLGVLQGDGSLRARHGMMLFADEDIPGFIEGAARATAGSKDEELAHDDVLALADEPTCRLPASGWDF